MKRFNIIEEGRLSNSAMCELKGGEDCLQFFCRPQYLIQPCMKYVICGKRGKDNMYISCTKDSFSEPCGGRGIVYKGAPGPGGFLPLL